jgi:PilZ domain
MQPRVDAGAASEQTRSRTMTRAEHRKTERLDTRLAVRCSRADATFDAETINLSLGGMLLRVVVDPAPQVGEQWQVEVVLPTLDAPLRATAEVRWLGLAGECGVQFSTGFRAKETWVLGQWLERVRKGTP